MAWQDALLDASFRGVPFQVMHVERAGQRVLVPHEFPFTNGASLEDQGMRPRRVGLRAVFWGDDYENEQHRFVTALEQGGVGELIHPVHGSMQVLAADWQDDHEAEAVDTVVVTVTFVEQSLRPPVFTSTSSAAKVDAIADRAQAARAAADEQLARRVQILPSINVPRLTVITDAFSQARSKLGELLAVTRAVPALLSDLDPLIYPMAYVGDLRAIVDVALQGLPFGGRNTQFDSSSGAIVLAGSGLSDYDTTRMLLNPAGLVLVPVATTPDADMVADVAVVQAHAQVHAASAIAEAAAILLAGELERTLLDRAEVEAVAGHARNALQVAINSARAALDGEGRGQAGAALRTLAWQLGEAARAVISQRPPVILRKSPVDGPVRLVAHMFYGDGDRAPELVRLTRLGRRVFVQLGEGVYGYAR